MLILVGCNSEGDFGSFSTSSSSNASGDPQENTSGLITAGEWNDLESWSFWTGLIDSEEHSAKQELWQFFNDNRISCVVSNNGQPVVDAKLELIKDEEVVWTSKTDNSGKAEFFIGLFEQNQSFEIDNYTLAINDQPIDQELKLFSDGINEVEFSSTEGTFEKVELAFIVDATSSMSDELEFIKDDLADVIQRVKNDNSEIDIFTSSVFYRDEGDEYVVRNSEFTNDITTTLSFINNQSAGGGGDFPEAVHSGMTTGIDGLQWSDEARTRLAFLLLDAPPHQEPQVITDLQNSIKSAASKGIKLIPITASGIDKSTEFLMRFFSISTNSTYVFITNDSGIGDDHIEPTVGAHEVEFLNDLMVRLIKEYSE